MGHERAQYHHQGARLPPPRPCDLRATSHTLTATSRATFQAALHDSLDYTPYEGVRVRGRVVRTLLRGATVYDAGGDGGASGGDGDDASSGGGDAGGGGRSSTAPAAAATAVAPPARGSGVFVACGRPELLGWQGEWPDAGDVVAQRCVTTLGPELDGVVAPAIFVEHPSEQIAVSSQQEEAAGGGGAVGVAESSDRKRPRA